MRWYNVLYVRIGIMEGLVQLLHLSELSVGKKNISSNIIQALPWYTYTYYLLHYIWNKSHLFKATLLFNSFRSISISSEKEDMM